jgi:hypothetical protein
MKTAVEQLAISLYEGGYLKGNGDEIQELVDKAKEMEKEQMQHWFGLGMQLVEGRLWKPIDKFEENFNETYGGK